MTTDPIEPVDSDIDESYADMLAAMEDLLDSFPGTLLVVSHDRYLIERVTDNQYAVTDGAFRHLPGGVDQYLELRKKQSSGGSAGSGGSPTAASGQKGKLAVGGAELRNAQKELASTGRKVVKAQDRIKSLHETLATHDQSDYTGLGVLSAELAQLEDTVVGLETRWLELSELVGS